MCCARDLLCFFHGGLILSLRSENFPFSKTLLLIIFFIRWEIEAQVKGEEEVEESRHEGCMDFTECQKSVL